MYRYFAKNIARQVVTGFWFFFALVVASTQCFGGILFEFSNGDGRTHYLFGTMHSADERVLKLLDQLQQPLSQSGQLVMEMVPDGVALVSSAASMMLPSGQDLQQLAGDALYAKVLAAAHDRGLSAPVLDRLKPWAVAVTLSLPRTEGSFLDQRIYQMALANQQPVFGLETVAEQLAAFNTMSESMQIRMLQEAVEQFDQLDAQYESLVSAYLARDLNLLKQLSAEYESSDTVLGDWFEKTIIEDRNITMADRLKQLVKESPTFVAVGALHLVGETGLITALEREGYTVRSLY